MLPGFNEDGNLPEGIHSATEAEVLSRFAVTSARRRWLGDQLHAIVSLARSTGQLRRVFLWRSFVTSKEFPNDLDMLLVMAEDFVLEALPSGHRVLFDHTRARISFRADVFWTKASMDAHMLERWLRTYQIGKDFRLRGIVEIIEK